MTKKRVFIIMFAFAVLFLARGVFNKRNILAMSDDGKTKGYLAIIIDDFGYDGDGTKEMLNLNVPYTAAVMPFSEKSAPDIAEMEQKNIEYIIHMPMQSLTGRPEWVGKGIYTKMSKDEVLDRINEAFKIEPNAVGMNNHMGSAVMENKQCLTYVLDYLKEHNLPFIDSMTSQKSKAEKVCSEDGCFLMKRNVFLDSTNDINYIKKQLKRAAKIAAEKGTCIAIGHVGPEGGKITAEAIKELYPEITKSGIEFVTISQMKEIKENECADTNKQIR
ncbi:MAG: divergent polysaccharide deacetylase family protein [Clostridia bacterium]|jgi:polysaccharide deacetylase 2 family uncharacterized protein YibQ|nr:divergent polysaccharide deacetylase family protein [Clostridia bacterium]MCI2000081.1 divergent polysaccharide deacetylase family protein [Clostridia bacterium]MCI2014385.1 divergent polysaccharide deacetylase family protein [Clostridia bacterium]